MIWLVNVSLLYRIIIAASLNATFSKMMSIQATPQMSLVDEKVKVTLHGLEPGSKVTLRSQLAEMKMKFEAHAYYQADDKGEVSLMENSSSGGGYTGMSVHVM